MFPQYQYQQGVEYNNNGVVTPCYVTSVTPTQEGFVYTLVGDVNDPNFPDGAAFGPFEDVAEDEITTRTSNDDADIASDGTIDAL